MNRGFQTLFVSAELRATQGKKSKNSILLFIIVFISLSSLGFGKAMLAYLKQKMDSPFVQFVDVPINLNVADEKLIEIFSTPELYKRFKYQKPYPIYTSYNRVIGSNGSFQDAYCRKVSAEDKLFDFITQSNDLMLSTYGEFTNFHSDFSCIPTYDFLKKLGFSDFIPNHLTILVNISENEDLKIPIHIKGVVTNLPDNVDLLLSGSLFDALTNKEPGSYDKMISFEYGRKFILSGNEIAISDLEELATKVDFKVSKEYQKFIEVEVFSEVDDVTILEFKKIPGVDTIYQTFDFSLLPQYGSSQNPDYMTFPFQSLDSISNFAQYLKDFKLKVDMSTIEAKENFRVFNHVGNVLSFVVRMISIILIALFSSNIILSHIDKNKKNLGTLKAFGFSNGQIVRIYTIVTTLFIGLVFISGYILAELVAPSLLKFIVEGIFQMNLGNIEMSYFRGVGFIEGALFFLAIPLALVSFNVYRHVKGQTPGDLIYERS